MDADTPGAEVPATDVAGHSAGRRHPLSANGGGVVQLAGAGWSWLAGWLVQSCVVDLWGQLQLAGARPCVSVPWGPAVKLTEADWAPAVW